jgi:hypothetical protein
MAVPQLPRALAASAALLVLVLVSCAPRAKDEPFALMPMDVVERLLGQPDVFVVDANPRDVFRKNHLPGARWWRSAALADLLPAQKDRRVVFYCASPS